MTPRRLLVFTFLLALLTLDSPGRAQYPGGAPRQPAPSSRGTDSDPLRPYGLRAGSEAETRGGYGRRPAPARSEPPRANFYAQRREYYPGLRSGYGPNRNVVAPETLCVPGRGLFFTRR